MKVSKALATPALIWLSFFILAPIFIIFLVSLAHRGTYGGIEWQWNFLNYLRAFSWDSLWILFESVKLALGTALVCSFVGLLAAWAMATANPSRRALLVSLIALPFLTNLIIRVYALKLFVGPDGPVQTTLNFLGVEFDPFLLTANPTLVWYGMVTSYLPFAILPLYGAFERFDFSLVEAAQDLGAGSGRIFWNVVLPAMARPMAGAFVLVLIPCLGEYVIPDLLGGAKTMLLGNLITEQFLKARDWPYGAAIAILMILLLFLVLLAQWWWSESKRRRAQS